jgi:lipoate-protein ligase A
VRSGYDLVRRPTGGAAVLHVDEITYSVTAGLGQTPLGRAVLEIHGGVARALAAAFRSVGFDVQFGGDGVPRDFACFSGAGGHEMTLAGRKLVGSALRRGRRAFLQHGSVLRSERHLELCSFMAGTAEKDREVARAELERRTCVIEDLEAERFAAALAAALGRECGLATERVDRFEALLAH